MDVAEEDVDETAAVEFAPVGPVVPPPPPPPLDTYVEGVKIRIIPEYRSGRTVYQPRCVARCPNQREHGEDCERSRGIYVEQRRYRVIPAICFCTVGRCVCSFALPPSFIRPVPC